MVHVILEIVWSACDSGDRVGDASANAASLQSRADYGLPITRIWRTGVVITRKYSVITIQL